MARIRTIKPEFFRHENLQDLELSHPELHPMLTFAALWGHCDKQGVFEWRPRQLALDILPFIWKGSIGEALGKSLELLAEYGFVVPMLHDGKKYGFVPSFEDHQRINGKEAQEKPKMPLLTEMINENEGSTGEAPGKQQRSQEGKGREEEGKGNKEGKGVYCSERSVEPSEPPIIEIILNTKELHPITQPDIDDWKELFPAVDILGELRKMAAWCKANPQRRKTDKGIRRFVVQWLSKEQDKGRKVPAVAGEGGGNDRPMSHREKVNRAAIDAFVNGED